MSDVEQEITEIVIRGKICMLEFNYGKSPK